jgi:hypothetical protein
MSMQSWIILGYEGQDLYMREIGAHRVNIENPIPGTPGIELGVRQRLIDGYYNSLTPSNKLKVDSGTYHGE